MAPIRVLQIVTSMNMGGIENYLMTNYRKIDRTRVQFDFLKHRDSHDLFDDEILDLGGKIYSVPPINPLRQHTYDRAVADFFRAHKDTYSIVHSHINTFSAYPLRLAAQEGIPVRIAHAHATTKKLDLKTPFRLYTKRILPRYITDAFACSEAAGNWLFADFPFSVLPNPIDATAFVPQADIRRKMRQALGISNRYVVGMVASFSAIKNHKFMVDVFAKVHTAMPNAVLLLVGDGPLREQVAAQVQSYGLEDAVVFAGVRKDIAHILQCMDVFVMPSISEGFAISALEAEATGLPCVLSTGVPPDVKLFPEMQTVFLPLEAQTQWVQTILSVATAPKIAWAEKIAQTDFDASKSAARLMRFYEEKMQSEFAVV